MRAVVEHAEASTRPGGVLARALAALLDGVVMGALLALTLYAHLLRQEVSVAGGTPSSAGLLLVAVLWVVYLAATTWRGATPGMRAVGLRVVRAGTPDRLGLGSSVVRSVALVVVVVALAAVSWWLLPLYGALMLLTASRRLPHDVLAGSAVVRELEAGESLRTGQPEGRGGLDQGAALDPVRVRALLDDLARTERAARADLHVSSVAVLVLGVLGVLAGAAALPDDRVWLWRILFWVLAAPAGPGLVLLTSTVVQRRAGIRPARGWLVTAVLIMGSGSAAGVVSANGALLVGLAFLAVAAHERSRLLAVCAVAFAVVVGVQELTGWFAYSLVANRVPDGALGALMSGHGSAVVEGLLGVVLLVVGLLAHRGEHVAR